MNIWYLLSVPALMVILVSAITRANDIPNDALHKALRWQVRRIGLLLVAAASVMELLTPFTLSRMSLGEVTWLHAALFWGWALTWFTTPYMPPWWRYILGDHRFGKSFSLLNEVRALWNSFNARSDASCCAGERRKEPRHANH